MLLRSAIRARRTWETGESDRDATVFLAFGKENNRSKILPRGTVQTCLGGLRNRVPTQIPHALSLDRHVLTSVVKPNPRANRWGDYVTCPTDAHRATCSTSCDSLQTSIFVFFFFFSCVGCVGIQYASPVRQGNRFETPKYLCPDVGSPVSACP